MALKLSKKEQNGNDISLLSTIEVQSCQILPSANYCAMQNHSFRSWYIFDPFKFLSSNMKKLLLHFNEQANAESWAVINGSLQNSPEETSQVHPLTTGPQMVQVGAVLSNVRCV